MVDVVQRSEGSPVLLQDEETSPGDLEARIRAVEFELILVDKDVRALKLENRAIVEELTLARDSIKMLSTTVSSLQKSLNDLAMEIANDLIKLTAKVTGHQELLDSIVDTVSAQGAALAGLTNIVNGQGLDITGYGNEIAELINKQGQIADILNK